MKVRVSPSIVLDIAKNYQSSSRILMEYIDNSIDSAEPLFNRATNSYKYPIHIHIKINSKNKSVTISDNCRGMDKNNLTRVAQDIGSSNKKGDFTTNGQFGFGFHSYAACARSITVTTLPENGSNLFQLTIDTSAYTDDGEIDEIISRPKQFFPIEGKNGTEVLISDFALDWWKQVEPDDLKKEIETHFERLLYRKNLDIKINFNDEEEVCKGFDYDSILGKVFERTIYTLESETNGAKYKLEIPIPLKVYLKITDEIIYNKRPIFTVLGRRIEEIQNISSYKRFSTYKNDVWGHSNLIGYVEVEGLIEPKQTRDDFTWSRKRDLVYAEILKIEKELYSELQEVNKKIESANLGKLENYISSALSKLAKEESMRFKADYSKGRDVNLSPDDKSESELINLSKNGLLGGDGNQPGQGLLGGGSTGGEEYGDAQKIPVVETVDDADTMGTPRKSSGMDLKFSGQQPQEVNGKQLRSQFLDGVGIIIYTLHPDFEVRVSKTRRGSLKITQRLVSYISSEIAIHFKDRFYEIRKTQPEIQNIVNHRMDLLEDITNFIYRFENILQDAVGKDLQTLEELE